MKAFLETGDAHALILEDDLHPKPGFETVLSSLLNLTSQWDMVRLAGLKLGNPACIAELSSGYSLTIPLHRFKGTGAYLLNRKAAKTLVQGLLPMWLPYDHALDREWTHGFRVASVAPFPISQTEEGFVSDIQSNAKRHLSPAIRWCWTYPYQVRNELSRWLVRLPRIAALKLSPPNRRT
jgi:glycosyl transferase family 25